MHIFPKDAIHIDWLIKMESQRAELLGAIRLPNNTFKAYTLLALSIIRTVYPKAVTENVKAVFQIDNQLFTATGTNIISPGWFAVDATPKVIGLPEIVKDNDYKVIGFDVKEGQNEPPKAFSAALIVKDGKIDFDFPAQSQKRSK